mmetsp:Transcript_24413/g.72388  ORF Transcript_24413/g.72388 Transcript_24413/m.72388 type:complete len:254 (+) Transcript_24413:599-1360(+)
MVRIWKVVPLDEARSGRPAAAAAHASSHPSTMSHRTSPENHGIASASAAAAGAAARSREVKENSATDRPMSSAARVSSCTRAALRCDSSVASVRNSSCRAVHPSCLTNHLPQSPSTSGVRARRSQKKAKSIPSWRASASSSPPATPHPSSLASVASSAASSSASWFTTPVFSRSRSSELSASRSRTASGSEPKAPNPPPRPLVLKVLAMNSSTNASASVSPPPSSCLRAATARTKATTRASRPFTACITPLLS